MSEESLKSITDYLKNEKNTIKIEESHDKEKKEETQKTENPLKSKSKIESKIHSYNKSVKENKEDIDSKLIHIRLPKKEALKLNMLKSNSMSNQAIVSYLVHEFLETKEIKTIIKKITDDLD